MNCIWILEVVLVEKRQRYPLLWSVFIFRIITYSRKKQKAAYGISLWHNLYMDATVIQMKSIPCLLSIFKQCVMERVLQYALGGLRSVAFIAFMYLELYRHNLVGRYFQIYCIDSISFFKDLLFKKTWPKMSQIKIYGAFLDTENFLVNNFHFSETSLVSYFPRLSPYCKLRLKVSVKKGRKRPFDIKREICIH